MNKNSDVGVILDNELPTQPETLAHKQKPAISPKEARKLLGKDICGDINDADLTKIIISLEQICRLLVLNLPNFNDERRKYGTKN